MWKDPAHCGASPCAGGPGGYKKAGWESHKEQAGKQDSSQPTVSVPAINLFLPQAAFDHGVLLQP